MPDVKSRTFSEILFYCRHATFERLQRRKRKRFFMNSEAPTGTGIGIIPEIAVDPVLTVIAPAGS